MTFECHSWQTARPPKGWTKRIRSALIRAVSLAGRSMLIARGQAAASRSLHRRFQAELDQAHTEIALLKEGLDFKDGRWSRLSSRRRPHNTAIERIRILQVKAARGWSREQTARAFLIDTSPSQVTAVAPRPSGPGPCPPPGSA